MISVEDWAEVRRLHRSEGMSQAGIARRLGISRNTVAKALASDRPPKYVRAPRGSSVDAVEGRVRGLLAEFPQMPATVIAERIGWAGSLTILKDRIRVLRPLFLGVDPTDRTDYEPGQIAQCDLWFPQVAIPVAVGQECVLPVLAITTGFSKMTAAVMIPSRKAGDILTGMWELLRGWGKVPRTLVWDRESAIGGMGRLTVEAAGFAGTLGVKIDLAPARDPEFKGMVERRNGYFETSFLPGRTFICPADFNAQLGEWLTERANVRRMRVIRARPVDLFDADRAAMVPLPPVAPAVGLTHRVRLGRDYYVRVAGCDYSVDPRVIGRFVDVTATPARVVATCAGQVVADHPRSWGRELTITEPAHRETARALRADLAARRRAAPTRAHGDGHVVAIRALPDYDALFGVDFDPDPSGRATAEGK